MQRGTVDDGDNASESSVRGVGRDDRAADRREGAGEPAMVSSSAARTADDGDSRTGARNSDPSALASDSTTQGTMGLSAEAIAAAFHNMNAPALHVAFDTAGLSAVQQHREQLQASYRQGNSIDQITTPGMMMVSSILPYQSQLLQHQIRPMAFLHPIPQAQVPLFHTNITPQLPTLDQYATDPTLLMRGISQIVARDLLLRSLQPQLQPQEQLQSEIGGQELLQHRQGQNMNRWPTTSSTSTSSSSIPYSPFVAAVSAPLHVTSPAPAPEVRHQGVGSAVNNANFHHNQPSSHFPYSSSATSRDAGPSVEPTRQEQTTQCDQGPYKPDTKQRKRSTADREKGSSRKKSTAKRRVDSKSSAPHDTDSPQELPPRRKKPRNSKDEQKPSSKATEQMQPSLGTSIPLIMPGDKEWLTKKECFLRINCFELFSATEDDITSNTSGRRNPVTLDQVGIRCVYCSKLPASMRAQRAMCFPSSIRTIQKAFVNLVHLHFPACPEIPGSVRATYESFKTSHSPMGSNEYRIESMESVLVDVGDAKGVRFKDNISASNLPDAPGKVVFGSDKKFVTDFAFLLFGQMQQCSFSSRDRAKLGSIHTLGYTGLACTHCSKASVMDGRFFPESPNGIACMHDAGEFYGHISKCPKTPQDVKDRLLEMKGKEDDQQKILKAGSKKEFFQRVWLRLHKSFNGKVYNSDGVVVDDDNM